MQVDPIPRGAAVSDAVFARFVEEILSGRWAAGEAVPSERDLAEAWQVNRHAIREALKRVQQAGLVRISHGGNTRVLDWHSHAGLDVITALAATGTIPPRKVLADVAVMRRGIGADCARQSARHADEERLDRVRRAAAALPVDGDLEQTALAALEFWVAVVEGADNIAYRLALNTLLSAIDDVGRDAINALNAAEITDRAAHLELAEAICARDPERAGRLAEALLSRFVEIVANSEIDENPESDVNGQ